MRAGQVRLAADVRLDGVGRVHVHHGHRARLLHPLPHGQVGQPSQVEPITGSVPRVAGQPNHGLPWAKLRPTTVPKYARFCVQLVVGQVRPQRGREELQRLLLHVLLYDGLRAPRVHTDTVPLPQPKTGAELAWIWLNLGWVRFGPVTKDPEWVLTHLTKLLSDGNTPRHEDPAWGRPDQGVCSEYRIQDTEY